jgi:hypothetical protein
VRRRPAHRTGDPTAGAVIRHSRIVAHGSARPRQLGPARGPRRDRATGRPRPGARSRAARVRWETPSRNAATSRACSRMPASSSVRRSISSSDRRAASGTTCPRRSGG